MTASDLKAQCDMAAACELSWGRAAALQGFSAMPAKKKKHRRCWATLLTTQSYAVGVKALAHSLVDNCDTEYPLIIMVTDALTETAVAELSQLPGAEVRLMAALPCPPGVPAYMSPQFKDTWTKLRVWELEDEFDRVVLLDADMVVVRNIDSLLEASTAFHRLPRPSTAFHRVPPPSTVSSGAQHPLHNGQTMGP